MPHRFLNRGPALEAEPVNLHTRTDDYEGFDEEVTRKQDEAERRLNELDPVVERIKAQCASNKPN